MYIDKIEITNIRAIEHFTMTFKQHAGWHVLIGDNGAGKSTIIRSVALAMLNVEDIFAARLDWSDWLQQNKEMGSVEISVLPEMKYESTEEILMNRVAISSKQGLDYDAISKNENLFSLFEVIFRGRRVYNMIENAIELAISGNQKNAHQDNVMSLALSGAYMPDTKPWFSAAYGPFRRFSGGSTVKEELFVTNPRLGSHLSAFGEDVALTETLNYIKSLHYQKLDSAANNKPIDNTLDNLIAFINQSNLLPHGAMIESISAHDGVLFKDGNGFLVKAIHMSDGYRSILSMTFELVRQLIRSYGSKTVFDNVQRGGKTIDVPGVVLIDEADAHLHPTWQTRIGQWFIEHFPNIQFIVTTHSPLICRACEKGSIWRLAAPGSGEKSGEITGIQRDRLIYGNVLEAYGTEAFGENVSQSEEGIEMGERLAYLNMRSFQGLITEEERTELFELKAKLPTAG